MSGGVKHHHRSQYHIELAGRYQQFGIDIGLGDSKAVGHQRSARACGCELDWGRIAHYREVHVNSPEATGGNQWRRIKLAVVGHGGRHPLHAVEPAEGGNRVAHRSRCTLGIGI